jgi:DNA polymerase II small subunit/DNA polymerase delta subunit B
VSKSKELSEVQKFYVDGNLEVGVQKLAVKLGVPVSTIKRYLESRADELSDQIKEEGAADEEKGTPTSHMITKTASGRSGVAIMTEAESMRADLASKKGKTATNVHTIR